MPNASAERRRAGREGAQSLTLGAREPVEVARQFLQEPTDGRGHEAQRRETSGAASDAIRSGVGAHTAAHASAAYDTWLSVTGTRAGKSDASCGAVSCPSPWNGSTPGNSPMTISRTRSIGTRDLPNRSTSQSRLS